MANLICKISASKESYDIKLIHYWIQPTRADRLLLTQDTNDFKRLLEISGNGTKTLPD